MSFNDIKTPSFIYNPTNQQVAYIYDKEYLADDGGYLLVKYVISTKYNKPRGVLTRKISYPVFKSEYKTLDDLPSEKRKVVIGNVFL